VRSDVLTKKRFEKLAGNPRNEELRVVDMAGHAFLHDHAPEAECFCRVARLAMCFYTALRLEPRNFARPCMHFLQSCALANFCNKSHFRA